MKLLLNIKKHFFKIFLFIAILLKFSLPFILLLIAKKFQHIYDFGHCPDFYANIASNIANGLGYRIFPDTNITMHREPAFIIYLATIFKIFGERYIIFRLFNVIFSLWIAYFIYKIGVILKLNKNIIRFSILLILFHPAFYLAESRLGVEIFFSLLLVVTIYFMLLAEKHNEKKYYVICGLISSLTALTRSTIIPFLLFWIIYLILKSFLNHNFKKTGINLIIYSIVLVTTFSIWPIRNYLLSKSLVITATVSGDSLFQGMYVNKNISNGKEYVFTLGDSTREQRKILKEAGLKPQRTGFFHLYNNVSDEIKHRDLMKEVVIKEYVNDPKLFISTIIINSWAFWIRGGTKISTLLNTILNIPILVFSLLGMINLIKNKYNIIPLIALILITYFVHLPILATARHHVPLIPFLMLFSSVTFYNLFDQVVKRANLRN